MSFLAPWFLAGAALIVGPLIAHLIKHVTRDRVAFSALRFLEASRPHLQRRSRFQHPWLLLLRCLIVALLAAAFARPFFRTEAARPTAPEAAQHVVVVLDESASMRRTGLWTDARERIVRVAETLRAADRCTVLAASSAVTSLLSSEQWTATPPEERVGLLRGILKDRQPSWGPLYLDAAMDAALATLGDTAEGAARQRVVVVSDFASGTRLSGLAGRDWPPGVEIVMERTAVPITNNAGVQFLGWTTSPGTPSQARIRVMRDRGAPALRLTLRVRDLLTGEAAAKDEVLDLPAGETRLIPVTVPAHVTNPLEVELSGDSEAFDNRTWIVQTPPRTATVVYLGNHESTDPQHAHFYVSRALSTAPELKVTTQRIDPHTSPETLRTASLAVVTEPLGAPALEALRQRIDQGMFAVVTLSGPELVATAAALCGETDWKPASTERGDALLGQLDFTHPLFSLFADPRFSDFSHLRFWRPQSLQLPSSSKATVVARFDDNSPAVLEASVGRGRVIVWGGDWSPAASQWVLSTKFVPWLHALLERASGGPTRTPYLSVNDASSLTGSPNAQWRASSAAGETFSTAVPTAPGAYQLRDDSGTRWIALQMPLDESRTDPLPLDAFEQLGVPLKTPTSRSEMAAAPVDTAGIEIEGRQKLWRWLLVAAAVLLAAESLAALWVVRRDAVAQPNAGA